MNLRTKVGCQLKQDIYVCKTDAVSSAAPFTDSASLQRVIHSHLLGIGFSKNGSGYYVDGELTKQKIRNLHAAQRLAILEQRRAFVETHGAQLAEHFASGNQVDPALIDPELVEVTPESLDSGSSGSLASCGPFRFPGIRPASSLLG